MVKPESFKGCDGHIHCRCAPVPDKELKTALRRFKRREMYREAKHQSAMRVANQILLRAGLGRHI